jgi:diguanylate cyclase (GGDEF)-like protein
MRSRDFRGQQVAEWPGGMHMARDDKRVAEAVPPANHIWLVEDDLEVARQVGGQLESFGYQVRHFDRIHAAEQAARQERTDILLMDLLFASEGLAAADVLLAHGSHLRALGCPILFITELDDFYSRLAAAHMGAAGYFLKPVDGPQVVARLAQIFERLAAPPPRVLVLDDDHLLANRYRNVLVAAGMQVAVVDNPEELIGEVVRFGPELILMDLHMQRFSGPDLASVIRQYDSLSLLPIVCLSAPADLERQRQAMGRGGEDVLAKPVADAQLVAALRLRIDRFRQLDAWVSRDSLTGLLRHANFMETVHAELGKERRSGMPLTLALLDIDQCKEVNERHGHAMGDVVIAALARLLQQRLRTSDIIGRYAGEEFAVLLPGCDVQAARGVVDDLRQRFAAVRFNHGDLGFGCTLSAGFVSSSQLPAAEAEGLLAAADDALYASKRGGRNRVRQWLTQLGAPLRSA